MTVAFQIQPEPLLSRERFHELVLRRSNGVCCFCAAPATAAHHILDRKLFEDGGYYLSNGAAVCDEHHWHCETTALDVAAVRAAASVRQIVIPHCLRAGGFDDLFDKWGNRLLQGAWIGYRLAGPLANDTGMNKALAAAHLKQWLLQEMPNG